MGFFSSIGKAISKGVKSVGKVLGSVAKIAAPIAALIPGVGIPISAGLGIVGGLLGPRDAAPAAYVAAAESLLPGSRPPPGSPYVLQQNETSGSGFGALAGAVALFLFLK